MFATSRRYSGKIQGLSDMNNISPAQTVMDAGLLSDS
jgi:hypothetical protein